jgi:hypothetical protein
MADWRRRAGDRVSITVLRFVEVVSPLVGVGRSSGHGVGADDLPWPAVSRQAAWRW